MTSKSSNDPSSGSINDSSQSPTPEELSQAMKVEVFDRDGATHSLGQLVGGKRTALIFIRHFGCTSCQAYVKGISESIPPASLRPDTQEVLIIGCGSYQPISNYIETTSSLYPVYTDVSRQLHSLFKFKSSLSMSATGDKQRDYIRDSGGNMSRVWSGIQYTLGNLHHASYFGPKALNGGEVILSANGTCEHMHRMQTTVDHTNISEISGLLGAQYDASAAGVDFAKPCEAVVVSEENHS